MTSSSIHSYGLGIVSKNSADEIIEVFYAHLDREPSAELTALLMQHAGISPGSNGYKALNKVEQSALLGDVKSVDESFAHHLQQLASTQQAVSLCVLSVDQAPTSIPEAFLKLQLISHRLARPHELNLDGLFMVLRNLAWTNEGAIDIDDLPARQLEARRDGRLLDVFSVDKFPRMTHYVVPKGVRIADTARVRLGAYVGEGTTVMHEGFINFNAGTLGAAMIEGRISAGVVVGENSDLGGSSSTMGTLSGGGTQIISVGRNCLIGANAGIGMPLADGCIVEAGLYVTAGSKVTLLDAEGKEIKTVKALELSSLENHLFRRNSQNGAIECVPLRKSVSLNEELHSNN